MPRQRGRLARGGTAADAGERQDRAGGGGQEDPAVGQDLAAGPAPSPTPSPTPTPSPSPNQAGVSAPLLLRAEFSDPDNLDGTLSDGDTLTLVFDRPTNRAGEGALSEAGDRTLVDKLLRFSHPLGERYVGRWAKP